VSGDVLMEPTARLLERPSVISPGVAPPEGTLYRVKNRLLGRPLSTEQLVHERLGKPTALAVFASDNLSSSAYATEEILRVLIPFVGVAAFALVVPITIALLVVLAFLILSYLQTIKAYPTAGGAYIVTRDNFGLLPAQVAGVALLTDYILTVAVSVAAGTAALVSAASALSPYVLEISILFVLLIAYGNLRGVRESGRVFAVPA
jgi:amino acid transporter